MVKVSAHVSRRRGEQSRTALGSNLGMRRDMVAPIWEGVEIIFDELTMAKTGEIVLTAVMLHAVKNQVRPATRKFLQTTAPKSHNRMERKLEYRFAPVELDGRTVTGIAVPWDKIGKQGPQGPRNGFYAEAFGRPFGSFPDFNLTKQHNRSLAVSANLRFSRFPFGP